MLPRVGHREQQEGPSVWSQAQDKAQPIPQRVPETSQSLCQSCQGKVQVALAGGLGASAYLSCRL